MNEFQTFHFVNCFVRYFPAADYLETVFQDGEKCPAQFTFEAEDCVKAYQLGYSVRLGKAKHMREAIRQLHLEHELSHTFIAEALGEPYCPVLRSVAVKEPCEGAWEREEIVMGWQKYLNTGKVTRSLNVGWKGEKYLATSAQEFIARFRK